MLNAKTSYLGSGVAEGDISPHSGNLCLLEELSVLGSTVVVVVVVVILCPFSVVLSIYKRF